jgi:hypothetical protein
VNREPGPWTAFGYKNRAEYRAAMQAAGQRHYPLESARRRQLEGKGYGHGKKGKQRREVKKFLEQLKGRGPVIIVLRNLVVRGWQYKQGQGWLISEAPTHSEVPVVVVGHEVYEQLQDAQSMEEVILALFNSAFEENFTADDILEYDEDIKIRDI